jgi:hypothetical protein
VQHLPLSHNTGYALHARGNVGARVSWYPSSLAPYKTRGYARGGVPRISSGMKKMRVKRCEAGAECDHHDHPTHMMVLGKNYQAICTGCGKAGPVLDEGPWAAQQALYYSARRAYKD